MSFPFPVRSPLPTTPSHTSSPAFPSSSCSSAFAARASAEFAISLTKSSPKPSATADARANASTPMPSRSVDSHSSPEEDCVPRPSSVDEELPARVKLAGLSPLCCSPPFSTRRTAGSAPRRSSTSGFSSLSGDPARDIAEAYPLLAGYGLPRGPSSPSLAVVFLSCDINDTSVSA